MSQCFKRKVTEEFFFSLCSGRGVRTEGSLSGDLAHLRDYVFNSHICTSSVECGEQGGLTGFTVQFNNHIEYNFTLNLSLYNRS